MHCRSFQHAKVNADLDERRIIRLGRGYQQLWPGGCRFSGLGKISRLLAAPPPVFAGLAAHVASSSAGAGSGRLGRRAGGC